MRLNYCASNWVLALYQNVSLKFRIWRDHPFDCPCPSCKEQNIKQGIFAEMMHQNNDTWLDSGYWFWQKDLGKNHIWIISMFIAIHHCTQSFHIGVSLNGGTPISHPKMIIFSRNPPIFSRETPFLVGKPPIFSRKTPHIKTCHFSTTEVQLRSHTRHWKWNICSSIFWQWWQLLEPRLYLYVSIYKLVQLMRIIQLALQTKQCWIILIVIIPSSFSKRHEIYIDIVVKSYSVIS